MIYRVSPRYRWLFRFWCVVAILIVVALIWAPTWRSETFPYRIVVPVVMAFAALYLGWQDYSLGYAIETSNAAITFTKPRRAPRSIAWNEITQIANRSRFGFLYIVTSDGTTVTIDHHVQGSQDLVGEIVTRTGLKVAEE